MKTHLDSSFEINLKDYISSKIEKPQYPVIVQRISNKTLYLCTYRYNGEHTITLLSLYDGTLINFSFDDESIEKYILLPKGLELKISNE